MKQLEIGANWESSQEGYLSSAWIQLLGWKLFRLQVLLVSIKTFY